MQQSKHEITVLSANVLQDNKQYTMLIDLIKAKSPDIVFLMEINDEWEVALRELDNIYNYSFKIPREDYHGMLLYTNLKVKECKKHFLISESHPSIEAMMEDTNGNNFIFWGIHPPPPSPTENATSKYKDAEILKLAKIIRNNQHNTIVAGDFNNVCWSRTSRLFSKLSKMKDARIGRGILGTFPVFPKFLRFPIDLIFHSHGIDIMDLDTLSDVGSDHLPVYCGFRINAYSEIQSESLTKSELQITKQVIQDAKEELLEEQSQKSTDI